MMAVTMTEQQVETIVIGGGQAGLATGHQLRVRGRDFVILDAGLEIGDSWRNRWDSLRLFTPAGFSHLPGMPLPARRDELATKNAMAEYLLAYANRFNLPVELGTRVESVSRAGKDLLVTATDGRRWRARNVVIANSAHGLPLIPDFAAELGDHVTQLHSSGYRRPSEMSTGAVLVVGAGNSGAEIALDLTRSTASGPERAVYLAGRDVGHVPPMGRVIFPLMRLLGGAGVALFERRLRGGGDPLVRIRPDDLKAAGVQRLPRVVGIRDGYPLTDDGRTVEVNTVVWCTGFRPDHRFLNLPLLDVDGRLTHRRGVTEQPGVYIVGMRNQSSITSHLIGGVGRDAAYVVDHLARRVETADGKNSA